MAKSSFYNTNPDAQLIRDLDSIISDARAAAASAHVDAGAASASQIAAANSQAAAAASAAAADVDAAAALASRNAAAASALAALNSQNAASASASTATTKASEASTSATNAAASASAALASKNAAGTSETNAAASAAAALASKNAAGTSETNALASKNAASTSATNSATSATASQTARTGAETARTGAEAARDLALQHRDSSYTAEQNAHNYANTAYLWAEKIDGPVTGSEYSARAWSNDAKQYRNTTLTYRDAAAASASAAANSAAAAATWDPSSYVQKTGGTYTGNLTITTTWPSLTLNKTASGQGNQIVGNVNGSLRWCIRPGDDVAEDGAGGGSDFSLLRFADNGTWIDAPMRISRKTGLMSLLGRPTWGATPWDSANFTPASKASLNTSVTFADVTADRGDGTGVIYFGNTGNRYAYYNGSSYQMPGAPLWVNGSPVWTSATFDPATKLNLTGGSVSGNITFTADDKGVILSRGGWLRDQNTGGNANAGRTLLFANNDSFDLLTENGSNAILSLTYAGSAPTFKGQTMWHAGNFNPATKADLTNASFSGTVSASRLLSTAHDLYNASAGTNLKTSRWYTTGGYSRFEILNDAYSTVLSTPITIDHTTGTIALSKVSSPLQIAAQGGNEGGEIQLAKPPTGSTIAGDVTIDMANDNFRVFEGAGAYRGVFVDMTKTQGGAGSALWHSGNMPAALKSPTALANNATISSSQSGLAYLMDLSTGVQVFNLPAVSSVYDGWSCVVFTNGNPSGYQTARVSAETGKIVLYSHVSDQHFYLAGRGEAFRFTWMPTFGPGVWFCELLKQPQPFRIARWYSGSGSWNSGSTSQVGIFFNGRGSDYAMFNTAGSGITGLPVTGSYRHLYRYQASASAGGGVTGAACMYGSNDTGTADSAVYSRYDVLTVGEDTKFMIADWSRYSAAGASSAAYYYMSGSGVWLYPDNNYMSIDFLGR